MKDPVARARAEDAMQQVGNVATVMAEQSRKIEDLRRLVAQAALDDDLPVKGDGGSLTTVSPTLSVTNRAAFDYIPKGTQRPDAAVRVAVLTVVLCFENLRDALQFDTWGGLQDATSLNERAQVLRGWLGTIAVVEREAATACYDELAGT